MKDNRKNNPFWVNAFLIFAVGLGMIACQAEIEETEEAPTFNPESIVGTYVGNGECVQADSTGALSIGTFTENDEITIYPGTENGFYEVQISSGPFYETEIGVLTGNVLRTATWDVMDNNFPVLEEYIFIMDENGTATGYTKIVRNPTKENFKSCVVNGEKQ